MPKNPQKTAVIYARISKDEQGTFSGVERQRQDCLDLAQQRGLQVTQIYIDNDISAYSGAVRPQYRRMLEELQTRKPDYVIAWHTDRLHRHPKELEEYIELTDKADASTLTVKAGELDLSTPSGKAVARTLGAWARFESEHKSDRIKRKKLQLAKDGRYVGGPVPYGYSKLPDKTLVLHPEESKDVAKAFKRFLNGASIDSIVRDFNSRGLKTRRGLEWNHTAMRNMLKRATYAGKSTHQGQVIGDGLQPAIVSEADWLAACQILQDPSRRRNAESKVRRLLAGIVQCAECGTPMKGSTRSSKAAVKNKDYYKCPSRGYGHSFQTADPIDTMITELVLERLSDNDVRRKLSAPDNPERVAELQTELVTLRSRLEQASESFAEGLIEKSQLATITATLRGKIQGAQNELATLSSGSAVPPVDDGEIRGWWEKASIEARRAVIKSMMAITLSPVKVSAPRRFDPRRVVIDWK
ncbi:recombinase family protein [Glutamicibacter nicotianae]|uniref:recombinase family protein n=1 Tax=Glutamicibacter nicotianae TaxID=37929 RepID=UPI000EF8A921|nr:recombinase family protein [Glutamicibacter nicotianae]